MAAIFCTLLFVLAAVEAWIPFLVAVVGSGAVSSFSTHFVSRRKNRADAEKTSVEAAQSALNVVLDSIKPLKEEVELLAGKVKVLEGERVALHERLNELQDENKHLEATVGYLKRLVSEAANGERLKTILLHSKEGVLLETPTRQIAHVNTAFLNLWGIPMTPEELLGADCRGAARGLEHLIPDVDEFERRVNTLIGEFRLVGDEPIELLDGRTLYRTFIPIKHADGSREVAWMYRASCQ